MRTNIEIDDVLIAKVMEMYGLKTKREAVELGLQELLGGPPMTTEEALAMRGRGWGGDLDAMRAADRERDEDLDARRNR